LREEHEKTVHCFEEVRVPLGFEELEAESCGQGRKKVSREIERERGRGGKGRTGEHGRLEELNEFVDLDKEGDGHFEVGAAVLSPRQRSLSRREKRERRCTRSAAEHKPARTPERANTE
jgi:hypothetical protein